MGRVARAGGYEIESAEVKEDGAPEASPVAEAAGHRFDLLDAGVEGGYLLKNFEEAGRDLDARRVRHTAS